MMKENTQKSKMRNNNQMIDTDCCEEEIHRNSREAFHQTNRLYNTIRQHYKRGKSRIFLHRNLCRQKNSFPSDPRLTVFYISKESGVKWSSNIPDLRCLWCRDSFFPFYHRHELLHHLRSCHGSLSYTLGAVDNQQKQVVIEVRLQRGLEAALNGSIDRFHAYGMEETLSYTANFGKNRKRDRNQKNENNINQNEVNEREQRQLKRRKLRSRAETKQNVNNEDMIQPNPNASSSSRRQKQKQNGNGRQRGSNGAKVEQKVEKGKPAFKSIEHAAKKNLLFHSVLQAPLSIDEFYNGNDSDADPTEEQKWRFGMKADEVNEYVDTISVEKLFMNLWNQFIRMEFVAYADKTIAPACVEFVKKYGYTIRRLNLEVTFLRHLTEMFRIGLIDSDNVHKTLMILGKMDGDTGNKGNENRLIFGERIEIEAAVEQRRKELKERRTHTA